MRYIYFPHKKKASFARCLSLDITWFSGISSFSLLLLAYNLPYENNFFHNIRVRTFRFKYCWTYWLWLWKSIRKTFRKILYSFPGIQNLFFRFDIMCNRTCRRNPFFSIYKRTDIGFIPRSSQHWGSDGYFTPWYVISCAFFHLPVQSRFPVVCISIPHIGLDRIFV